MKVVQSHHQVLSHWAEYRNTLKHAPILITLDHHTDTSFPFRSYLGSHYPGDKAKQEQTRRELMSEIDFKNAESVKKAESFLSHDEHIMTALGSGILSAAFVIAQNAQDTDIAVYREHRVCCYAVGREGPRVLLSEINQVLETRFLQKALQHFDDVRTENAENALLDQDYIFDVDLDYFNTVQSTRPQNADLYLQLYKNAGLVTVAMEPEHVVICAREGGLTSEKLLENLKQLHAPAD